MLRPPLALMLVSSMLSPALLSGDKPTLKLLTGHSAVLPGEHVKFECVSPKPRNYSVDFHLHTNGTFIEKKNAENSTTFNVMVNTSGWYSCNCSYDKSNSIHSSESITITVVNLMKPNINFSTSGDWFHWWLQDLEVTRGYSFSIICSTQPQFPGGSFNLSFIGESSKKINQSAVNHSTTFDFSEAYYGDHGNYSCVYAVNVSKRTFTSSNSEPLAVIVKESLIPYISAGAAAVGLLFILVPIIIFFIMKKRRKKNQSYRVRTLGGNENTEMDVDDYENAAMTLQQRRDSDASSADYVDIDAEIEKTALGNNKKCAGAKNTYKTTCARNETEDEDEDDDYENADPINPEKEGSDESDEDYVNVGDDVEKTAVPCVGAKNTKTVTCLRKDTETAGSDDSDDDYINVEDDVGKTVTQNHCAADDKRTRETAHTESDLDDEDNYENPDPAQQIEDSDFSDDDYVNVN